MANDKLAEMAKSQALKNQVKETGFKGMNDDKITSFISENYRVKIAQLLPEDMRKDSERVIQMCAMVISQNQALKECTPASIIGAVLNCAMLGFNPNPQFNQCFFIPYKENKQVNGQWVNTMVCQFQIGYAGWSKLLYNTGLVRSLEVEAVHNEDVFEDNYGSTREIKHKKCGKTPNQSTFKAVYMIVKLQGMGTFHHVLYREKIEQLRIKGCKKVNGVLDTKLAKAWETDYDEMAKNKIIKHMIRHKLPVSDVMVGEAKLPMGAISSTDEAIIDITEANMTDKKLVATQIEDEEPTPENEPEKTYELEVVQTNPKPIKDLAIEYLSKPYESLDLSEIELIEAAILAGLVEIESIPNEYLGSKKIENAIFEVEKRTQQSS